MTTNAQDVGSERDVYSQTDSYAGEPRFIPIVFLRQDGALQATTVRETIVFGATTCCHCPAPAAIAVAHEMGAARIMYCSRHSPLRPDRPDVPNDYVPFGARYGPT